MSVCVYASCGGNGLTPIWWIVGPRPVYIFLSSCSDRSDTRPSLLRPHVGPCSAAANHASKRTEIKNKQMSCWTALLSRQTWHHQTVQTMSGTDENSFLWRDDVNNISSALCRMSCLNLCIIIFHKDKLSQRKRGLHVCWNESAPCWGDLMIRQILQIIFFRY